MLQQLRLEFGDKSHKSCKNTYAPLYSVTRTFTDGGVLMSRVTFKRGSTILCSEKFSRPQIKCYNFTINFTNGTTFLLSYAGLVKFIFSKLAEKSGSSYYYDTMYV